MMRIDHNGLYGLGVRFGGILVTTYGRGPYDNMFQDYMVLDH